uniref:Myosin motor domain-containing protein n=1 Tax=Anopheles maculatus TaxID=74869 RepID=A0A182SKZ4_9DIPT
MLQKENREYPDLCQLPDLNEATLLENLRQRFEAGHIYTYVGSILIAVNPFKFHPIYNPKYVRLYQNQRIGPILPPHIFAIADNAYYNMLKEKRNQRHHYAQHLLHHRRHHSRRRQCIRVVHLTG